MPAPLHKAYYEIKRRTFPTWTLAQYFSLEWQTTICHMPGTLRSDHLTSSDKALAALRGTEMSRYICKAIIRLISEDNHISWKKGHAFQNSNQVRLTFSVKPKMNTTRIC